jgi:superfamily II DNA/RNA helicase
VAARGHAIPAESHVLNYDVPHHAEDYVHRIGRTGRAGRTGHAVTLVAPGDEKSLAAIEKLIGQAVAWEGSPLRQGGPDERPPRGERGRGRERKSARDGGRKSGREGGGRKSEAERAPRRARDDAPLPDRQSRPGDERRQEPRKAPRQDARHDARLEARHEPRKAPQERNRERHRADTDRPVTGLGDHIPAFLMRPAVSKGPKAGS